MVFLIFNSFDREHKAFPFEFSYIFTFIMNENYNKFGQIRLYAEWARLHCG